MRTLKHLPAAALAVALFSSSSFAGNADFRFGSGDVSFGIHIGTPPPRVVEYVPVAVPGHVWVPGYWAWNGHRYAWHRGAWQRAWPGHGLAAGHWRQRGEHWRGEPPRRDTRGTYENHRGHHGYAPR